MRANTRFLPYSLDFTFVVVVAGEADARGYVPDSTMGLGRSRWSFLLRSWLMHSHRRESFEVPATDHLSAQFGAASDGSTGASLHHWSAFERRWIGCGTA